MNKALIWWRKLSDSQKNIYEYEMFGSGEWWEYNKLTNKDILSIYKKKQ